RRCATSIGGNPLGLLELVRRLTHDQRIGTEPLPDPLPLPARLADAFQPVLDALAPPTRTAIGVAAMARTPAIEPIRAALDALDVGQDELLVAEEAGLIRLG